MKPWNLIPIVCAIACTDIGLYSEARERNEPDRVTLAGRVCTDDPATARFPLRVVLLVDQAQGPLFATFDPAGRRLEALSGFVQRTLGSSSNAVAVVGYAGRARTLAPSEGSFTRNPGELLAALSQLGIAEPCLATRCRDYLEGLRSARALIEGDMASLTAGERVLTQYMVVHVLAGPQEPLAERTAQGTECPGELVDCQREREVAEVNALREAVGLGGAGGLRYHVLHLAAESPEDNESLAVGLRQVALAGRGLYQRIGAPAALDAGALDLLDFRTELSAKHLIVANVNAKPSARGPLVDSDGDGLSDNEESRLGTSPTQRDTDGDGIGDFVEVLVGLRPLEVDAPVACERLVFGRDSDRDGLSDCDERLIGTDPSLVDSDGDGLPDRLELYSQLDYLHPDADLDADGDGVTNGVELQQRTDPRSSDLDNGLAYGYRYELDDEGLVEERFVSRLPTLTGLTVLHVSEGTTPGIGLLEWSATLSALRWRDPFEGRAGAFVTIDDSGEYLLGAESYAPIQGEAGRFLRVRVAVDELPGLDVAENARVGLRSRNCVTWTVRNVRLMPTLADPNAPAGLAGKNDILVYFAQAPEKRLAVAGPVRLASVPFVYAPPNRREPSGAVIEVLDSEFVTPRTSSR